MTDPSNVSLRSSIAGTYQGTSRPSNTTPGQQNEPAAAGDGTRVKDGATVAEPAEPRRTGGPEQSELSGEELNDAVSELNELAQSIRRELRFSLDDDSGRAVIEVYDVTTEELIRQIPPEQVLNVLRHLKEFDSGLLQEKA